MITLTEPEDPLKTSEADVPVRVVEEAGEVVEDTLVRLVIAASGSNVGLPTICVPPSLMTPPAAKSMATLVEPDAVLKVKVPPTLSVVV